MNSTCRFCADPLGFADELERAAAGNPICGSCHARGVDQAAKGAMTQDTEIGAAVRAILAARPSFAVGDRVRMRISAECPRTTAGETGGGVLDGQTGTVDDIRHPGYRDGHHVGVRLDRPVPGYVYVGVWATPTELERIEP